MRRIDMIVVHCSATPPSMDIHAETIARWHRARGWLGIGYHFVITRGGKVEQGRDLERIGAHAEGYNAHSIGICLVGGVSEARADVPEDNFTPEQKEELAYLIESLAERFPQARVLGHRDLPGVTKACPSFDVRSWMASHKYARGGKHS